MSDRKSCPLRPSRAAILAVAFAQLTGVAARADTPGAAPPAAAEDLINPDRPGIADGSTTIGPDHFQAEVGLQYEYHRDEQGHVQLIFLPTLLRFGLSNAWELRIEGNGYSWQRSNLDGQASETDGFAPASAGVKYHFIDDGGFSRPSVGVILRIFPQAGGSVLHTHRTTGDLRLVADWNVAPEWSLNPNIGIARIEDQNQRAATPVLFAMTLNYNPTPAATYFVDTGMQSAEQHHGRASIIVDGGVAYILGRDTQLDASVGWGVMGETAAQPFLSIGISERF